MIDCISPDCDQQATVAVYWPGGPARAMCGPCMLRAARVASVMGLQLPVGDISVLLEPMAKEVEDALDLGSIQGRSVDLMILDDPDDLEEA